MDASLEEKPDLLVDILNAIELEDFVDIAEKLDQEHQSDIATLLQSIPQKSRLDIWTDILPDRKGLVLVEMNEDAAKALLEETSADDLIIGLSELDADEQAYLLSITPDETVPQVLTSMDQQQRALLEQSLSYPEDQAGRIMDTDFLTVRPQVTADAVLRFLRRHDEIPEHTDLIMVVDVRYKLIGVLPIRTLLVAQPSTIVFDIMDDEYAVVSDIDALDDVAKLIEGHDLISVPVINEENKLVGRITVDDIVDHIKESADKKLMSLAGLDEDDDLFEPVRPSVLSRLPWLAINLCSALISATVISQFSPTLEQIVALAILMPVVASMGGIAGSQTMTLAIRGIALGHLQNSNAKLLINKELAVGMANGLMWSIIIGIISYLWFNQIKLGIVIAAAIFINMTIAGLAGSIIPLMLNRFNIDPALAAPMFLTTVTDVIGFLTFLGLATAFLLT
jgi:magnesium transporter